MSFNPYSPGFSIYLLKRGVEVTVKAEASILIHLDFLSILKNWMMNVELSSGFNPYSPGFSIYFYNMFPARELAEKASILIHLDFLSIL